MNDRIDVVNGKERVKDAIGLIELDEASSRHHAAHLRFEVVPLSPAIEILEDGKAALQQVRTERFGLAIGELPESGLPHERDRKLRQLRIIEGKDTAAIQPDVQRGELAQDLREVLFGSRIIVIPCRAPDTARSTAVAPHQSHEDRTSVVLDVIAVGGLQRSRRRAAARTPALRL